MYFNYNHLFIFVVKSNCQLSVFLTNSILSHRKLSFWNDTYCDMINGTGT